MTRPAKTWVIIVICIVGAVVAWEGGKATNHLAAASRKAAESVKPATEQLVVWSLIDKNAPAHYINYGVEDGGYTAACGRHLVGMGGTTQFGDIARMKAEGRKPCPDCIKAMQIYTTPA